MKMKSNIEVDSNHSKKFWVKASRVGVFPYQEDENTVWRYRPAAAVFNKAAIDEAIGMAVTIDHPDHFVDGKNWKDLQVGTVVESKIEDDCLWFRVAIHDSQTQDFIQNKLLTEVSLGFEAIYEKETGIYENQPYDEKLEVIRYNHLAIGPENWARLPDARIYLDSLNKKKEDSMPTKNKEEKQELKLEDTSVFEEQIKELSEANKNLVNQIDKEEVKEEDEKEYTLDTLKEKLDSLEKKLLDFMKEKEKDSEEEKKEDAEEEKKEEKDSKEQVDSHEELKQKFHTALLVARMTDSQPDIDTDEKEMIFNFFGDSLTEKEKAQSIHFLRGMLAQASKQKAVSTKKSDNVIVVKDRSDENNGVQYLTLESLPLAGGRK
jgi:hypothetical protein